jgi:hypothetical protein
MEKKIHMLCRLLVNVLGNGSEFTGTDLWISNDGDGRFTIQAKGLEVAYSRINVGAWFGDDTYTLNQA